ncbi:hypothetical protein ACFQ3S_02000 [Mucilaginibacter terrae]|uniref:hypothetical protein n=1 Tax=Mucilaginibacter terrae TaxID=1955052 RepID=UPI00362F2909
MEESQIKPQNWWLHQRIKFNRGLLIGGMVTFVIYTLYSSRFFDAMEFNSMLNFMMVQVIIYFFYMIMANVFYTAGWLADVLLNTSNSQRFRNTVFNYGYWFAVCLPIAVILVFVTFMSVNV